MNMSTFTIIIRTLAIIALFTMLGYFCTACSAQVEQSQDANAPVCLASQDVGTGDQRVCDTGAIAVECSAPASAARLAGYGQCTPGLAHANTYCCTVPFVVGSECGALYSGTNGSVTYGIYNSAVTSCLALGGQCLPRAGSGTSANTDKVFCVAQ